jgi:1,4-alpha-glucan branching enzyme
MGKGRRRKGPAARLVLVLHAHLPYARIPEERFPAQELWLHQNIAECYIPLLRAMERLAGDGVHFPLTISLSPPLVAMLGDGYYRRKFADYLDCVTALARAHATPDGGALSAALSHLADRLGETRDWWNAADGDLAARFRLLSERGAVTLVTTTATHALLPAYRFSSALERLQIRTGQNVFARAFGPAPRGLWLPEMGYHAGLDGLLRDCGVEYTFLEAHAAYHAEDGPEHGNFMPFVSETGLAIFPRELRLSGAVWAHRVGYPGDARYREFHADHTWRMSEHELARIGLERMPLGIKVHRITGNDVPREPYDHREGEAAAREHAADFVARIRDRAAEVAPLLGRSPVFTLPFDMELFGHWWHEGPVFLEELARLADRAGDIAFVTPEELLREGIDSRGRPAESSWGKSGYFDTWLNPACLHAYPIIAELGGRLVAHRPNARTLIAYRQAAAEIMLAQSSDWPFFIAWDRFADYGRARLDEHITAAARILAGIETGELDDDYVRTRVERYPLFAASSIESII